MAKAVRDTRWGMPTAAWEAAVDEMRAALIRCAKAGETIAYSELCDAVEAARIRPYSWAFMAMLEEACRDEDARTGTVLATLVVRKDSGRPGEGYFAWAEREGALFTDREEFWESQAGAVWAAYSAVT